MSMSSASKDHPSPFPPPFDGGDKDSFSPSAALFLSSSDVDPAAEDASESEVEVSEFFLFRFFCRLISFLLSICLLAALSNVLFALEAVDVEAGADGHRL